MKDGQIKTGEAYSNSINPRSAKADIISKLEKAGYSSITILAIEAGDPDLVGCNNTFVKQPEQVQTFEDDNLDEAGEDEESDNAKSDTEEDKKPEDDGDKDDSAKDEEGDDKSDSDENTDKEEDVKEPDEKLKDDADDKAEDTDDKDTEELDASEKAALKDSYKKAFKAAMLKCKYVDKCFDDLTLEEKVKFFETISKAWENKADPSKFMTDKESEQLQKIIIKN